MFGCVYLYKKIRKPQHKCRRAFCDQPVNQICQCNIKDPNLNNPMHRIHKSMKSCNITKELQQKLSTNMDPLMCTECGRTAKTSAALECHMKSLYGMSVRLPKCNVCEKEFISYYKLETHTRQYEIIKNLKSKNKSTLK